jgi:hypothetical protein
MDDDTKADMFKRGLRPRKQFYQRFIESVWAAEAAGRTVLGLNELKELARLIAADINDEMENASYH